jgi:endonuclease III-like uncharacterized protein
VEKFIYQAIWQDNTAFDEVLISPVMLQDHMPDKVLEALEKVLEDKDNAAINYLQNPQIGDRDIKLENCDSSDYLNSSSFQNTSV